MKKKILVTSKPHHWTGQIHFNNTTIGFIYAIINTVTQETYYGRKQIVKFRKGRKLPDESWRFYTGTSKNLANAIKEYGYDKFEFHILASFQSKTGMSLAESIAIVCSGCLEKPHLYYNRAAPAIRGALKVIPEDAEGFTKVRQFIRKRSLELRCYEEAKNRSRD